MKIRHIALALILLFSGLNGAFAQNLTKATIKRTSSLVITVYAKPTSTVNSGTNLNILFAVSLPGGMGPTSLTAASLVGGTMTAASFEVLGGRKCYPFIIEGVSTVALTAGQDNPIATVTFPSSESGDVVQLNDFSGQPLNINCYWYISYFGNDGTDYSNMFYGTNPVNAWPGDSKVDANFPLPITLVSFDAEKFQEKSTYLSWVSSSESNSSHYLVQRSADKLSWTNIGKVDAAGNSISILNYHFIDENVYTGKEASQTFYYRLQMVDLDGQTKTSPIESVEFGSKAREATSSFSVYPNPASDGIQVEWDANVVDQPTSIEIYDIAGKRILTAKVGDQTTQQYIDFGPTNIQTGLYLMRLMKGDQAIDHKQIVVSRN